METNADHEVTKLPNGSALYMEDNLTGGHTYISDEVGGGVVVWDTAQVDMSTLLAAIVHEQTYEMACQYSINLKIHPYCGTCHMYTGLRGHYGKPCSNT